jgi:hypothetical protein
MNDKLNSRIHGGSSTSARALSLLLLALILYGSTVEAAHRHGRVLVSSQETSTSIQDSSQANQALNGKPSCSDCLICQLQQNFSSTLTSFALLDTPVAASIPTSHDSSGKFHSRYCSPLRGRAPPITS